MIEIIEQHLSAIRQHGERDYPFECCGLMLGRFETSGKVVAATYPISNAREEEAKRNRFLIRPEELLRGERYAGAKDLDIVGFYHSHPDHPARPSAYDLEHAWPNLIYVILSIDSQRTGELTAWLLSDDRSRFEPVELRRGEPDANHDLHSHTAAALHE